MKVIYKDAEDNAKALRVMDVTSTEYYNDVVAVYKGAAVDVGDTEDEIKAVVKGFYQTGGMVLYGSYGNSDLYVFDVTENVSDRIVNELYNTDKADLTKYIACLK